jgi:hypothetical protein
MLLFSAIKIHVLLLCEIFDLDWILFVMSSDYILSAILRWSVFGTFFGHGCLAVRFVPGWLPYLRVVGIGNQWAR